MGRGAVGGAGEIEGRVLSSTLAYRCERADEYASVRFGTRLKGTAEPTGLI
jgi:hypothetical protein